MAEEINEAENETVIVNETLCYIQNNFQIHGREKLIPIIGGFYSQDELFAAKNKLGITAAAKLDNFVATSHKKKKTDEAKDIIQLWAKLIENNIYLPKYCAANLERIPSHPDVNAANYEYENIYSLLRDIKQEVSQIKGTPAPTTNTTQPPNSLSLSSFPPLVSSQTFEFEAAKPINSVGQLGLQTQAAAISWAEQLKSAPMDTRGSEGMRQRPYIPTIRGSRPVKDCRIKTTRKKMHLFVGRLDIETTAEELESYLQEQDIPDVTCKKLNGTDRNGRTYKSAAFMVSYDSKYRDQIKESYIWPEEATVRDWTFKPQTYEKQPTEQHSIQTSKDEKPEKTDKSLIPLANNSPRPLSSTTPQPTLSSSTTPRSSTSDAPKAASGKGQKQSNATNIGKAVKR